MTLLRSWTTQERQDRGFTIMEVLVALSLLGLVMLVASTAFSAPFRAYLAGRKLADEQQNARLVLEWMTRRVRLAGVGVPLGTSEYFTEAGLNAVAFQADVDGDGTAELHRLCLDGAAGVVREQVGAVVTTTCTTGAPLTSRGVKPLTVVLLQFAYFDGQQVPLMPLPLDPAQRPAVAWVRIILGLDSNLSGAYELGTDLTFTMDASVRNY